MKPYSLMTEAELQTAVAEYLVRQYPDVLFHSDFGSGTKLNPAQAKRQKRQNGYRKGWPDMFIAEPMFCDRRWADPELRFDYGSMAADVTCGLFLELKKYGTRLKKKNGDWATGHVAEQATVLEELRKRGYCAEFAVGFESAKEIIDEYLGGK